MKTFYRLLTFLKPYRGAVIASFALAAGAMATAVVIPWLVGQAVDEIKAGRRPSLLPLALAVVAAGLLRLAFSVTRRIVSGRVSLGVEYDLRERVYSHLQALDLEFFDRQQTGQLMSRATVDLQAIRFFLGYGLIFIVQSFLTILLAGTVMFAVKPGLAALALAPVPLVVYAARRYGRQSRPALQEVQQRLAELTEEAEENISGIRVVKAFAREAHQLARFRRVVGRVFDQSMFATRLRATYNPLIAFLPNIGLVIVLLYGGRLVVHGGLSLGEFVAFYTYLLMLLTPMRMLGMALGMGQRAVASGNRLFEILDRKPKLVIRPEAPPLPPGDGRVTLRGVTFSYDGGGAALSNVDLEVPAGCTVALVGTTGSGKTTLLALLCRLYDPDTGSVQIDGADVRDLDLKSLRRQIAWVADDTFLFSASVRENIAYAKPNASTEEIEQAARRAQIHDFITGLPDGYDTLIGERGLTLSGGQRQRIAIARALASDPRILILDDATSSVDARTEGAIGKGLGEVMRGRTTFIVAHRPSSVALAEEIAVLDQGRLTAYGPHAELKEKSDAYRELMESATWERLPAHEREADRGDEPAQEAMGL